VFTFLQDTVAEFNGRLGWLHDNNWLFFPSFDHNARYGTAAKMHHKLWD
jgi:hypothetical protein